MITTTLTFVNQHGLFEGATTAYQTLMADLGVGTASQQLIADMTALLTDDESPCRPGERLPISTEILESSFARYSRVRQEQAKPSPTDRRGDDDGKTSDALVPRATPRGVRSRCRHLLVAGVATLHAVAAPAS